MGLWGFCRQKKWATSARQGLSPGVSMGCKIYSSFCPFLYFNFFSEAKGDDTSEDEEVRGRLRLKKQQQQEEVTTTTSLQNEFFFFFKTLTEPHFGTSKLSWSPNMITNFCPFFYYIPRQHLLVLFLFFS